MNPIRLTTEKTIILALHVETVRVVEGRPIKQRDGILMYSYSLDNRNDYPTTLCHTPTAAIVRYTSGTVEVYGGADQDLIWAAFNKHAALPAATPECLPERHNEQEPSQVRPAVTVLEGYGIKLEVTGARPKPALTEWVRGCPTFKIVSRLHRCNDLPQKVLQVLQDGWYLDYAIKVEEDSRLTLDDHQGLWLITSDPESVLAYSTLLMAYSEYVEPL